MEEDEQVEECEQLEVYEHTKMAPTYDKPRPFHHREKLIFQIQSVVPANTKFGSSKLIRHLTSFGIRVQSDLV